MKRLHTTLAFAGLLLLFVPGVLAAESMSEIKQAMAKRLPTINELKREQLVGENNQGYLKILKDDALDKKQRKMIAEENDDRRAVYAYIAEKTDSTVELVGERRALQIAKESAGGIMLQSKDGQWYVKKE